MKMNLSTGSKKADLAYILSSISAIAFLIVFGWAWVSGMETIKNVVPILMITAAVATICFFIGESIYTREVLSGNKNIR